METRTSSAVPTALVLVCGVALAAAGSTLRGSEQRAPHLGLEGVLGIGLSVLGLGIVGLWLLALAIALVAELFLRGGRPTAARITARCTPTTMRRLAAVILGVHLLAVPAVAQAADDRAARADPPCSSPAMVSPPAAAAAAEDTPAAAAEAAEDTPPEPVTPAWKPAPIPADGGVLLRQETRSARQAVEVVVAPGDSLWSIVAGRLGPLATAADVAEAWPAWFEANRLVIGDDPSFLLPGQILQAPPP